LTLESAAKKGGAVIRFQCEQCGKQLAIKKARPGAVVTCPGCKEKVRVQGGAAPAERDEGFEETISFSRWGLLKGLAWFLSMHLIGLLMTVAAAIGCPLMVMKESVSFNMLMGLVMMALAGVVGFCYFVLTLPNWRLFLFSKIPSSDHYLVTEDRLVRYSRSDEVVEEVPFANIASVRLLTRRNVENPEITAKILGIDLIDPDDPETTLDHHFCRWSQKMHGHDLVFIDDFFGGPIKAVSRKIKKPWQRWQEAGGVPVEEPARRPRRREALAWYQRPLTYVLAGMGLLGLVGLVLLVWLVSLLRSSTDSGQAAAPPGGGPGPAQAGSPAEGGGPAAYWPLDEAQGDSVNDKSGNGSLGRIHGGQWVQGVTGSAVRLDGKGSYVELGLAQQFNFGAAAPFTIAGWVATEPNGVICSFRALRSPFPVIEISVRQGHLAGWVRDDTSGFGGAKLTGGAVNDGKWHHVALLRQADGTIELFLDGASQGTARGANSGGPITTDLRALGCDRVLMNQGKPAGHLAGAFDELSVYSRPLAPAEISALAGRK
jgi:hypothetical protein